MRATIVVCLTLGLSVLWQGCGLNSDPTGLFGEGGNAAGQGGGGQGGTDGGTAGSTSTGGNAGQGGSGGNAGSTSTGGSAGQGGSGGNAGSGGSGGQGGSDGGMGGSGGATTCNDPPANNAVTFACTTACYKVILDKFGTPDNAESSPDDSQCQPNSPTETFVTHPHAGNTLMVWINDPANNNAISATSMGSYPSSCKTRCASAFSPGPAPNHAQMEGDLFLPGYMTVSCGLNPAITLTNASCADGAEFLLLY